MTRVEGEVIVVFDYIFQNWHLSNRLLKYYVNVMAVKTLKKASWKGGSGRHWEKVVKKNGAFCMYLHLLPPNLAYSARSLLPVMLEIGCAPGKQFAFVKWLSA